MESDHPRPDDLECVEAARREVAAPIEVLGIREVDGQFGPRHRVVGVERAAQEVAPVLQHLVGLAGAHPAVRRQGLHL